MDAWDILREVWNLPWYKIIVVALADDAIVFIKVVLPVLILVVATGLAVATAERWRGGRRR